MTNRRSRKRVPDPDKIVYPVIAKASRAMYPDYAIGSPHRISLQFEDAKGDVTQIDLEVKEAVELIESMTAAYQAIVPPLRTSRVGWGG